MIDLASANTALVALESDFMALLPQKMAFSLEVPEYGAVFLRFVRRAEWQEAAESVGLICED